MKVFTRERVVLNGAERPSGMIADEVELCEEWLDSTSDLASDAQALPTLWGRCIGIQTDLEAAIGHAEFSLELERARLIKLAAATTPSKDLKQWVVDAEIDTDLAVQALEQKLIGLRADLKYVQKYMAGIELAAGLVKARASIFVRDGVLENASSVKTEPAPEPPSEPEPEPVRETRRRKATPANGEQTLGR